MSVAAVLDRMRALLGPAGFTDAQEDMAPWLSDWRGRITGRALAMASPANVEEVAGLVRLAASAGIGIVPQGGNTSMVAGATPSPDGGAVLLSLRRMRRIRAVLPDENVLIAEAGAILADVHEAALAQGRIFPLSLGAKGSATIGGLVSTNAGGVQVLRYGTMRALTLGVEAVLADGSIHNGLKPLRKDNRGYDLKQLLIGAEGTLGIVTAATLVLAPKPVARVTAWLGLRALSDSLPLLRRLEALTGGQVSSFEIVPQTGIDLVTAHLPDMRPPLAGRHDWHVLVDIESSRPDDPLADIVEAALADAMEAGRVADAVIAMNEAQADALWLIRESLPEAERREGGAAKHDIAVAVSDMPDFILNTIPKVEQAFAGSRVLAFGHLGDGNVHFNVRPPSGADGPQWLDRNMDAVNAFVHDAVAAMGGTLSAEHGIGVLKRDEFARLAEPGRLEWMRAVKSALDPAGIMNPGKLLPPCGGATQPIVK